MGVHSQTKKVVLPLQPSACLQIPPATAHAADGADCAARREFTPVRILPQCFQLVQATMGPDHSGRLASAAVKWNLISAGSPRSWVSVAKKSN